MSEQPRDRNAPLDDPQLVSPNLDRFRKQIEAREQQKVSARQHKDHTLLVGFSAFGAVGWSIAVPTLLGVILGLWLDRRFPGHFSWSLAMLLAGVTLGCLSAWLWVSKEQQSIDNRRNDSH
ncbi:AtpZ/AtpI family protein [Schlesneria sp. DSM 10557]|uniref:AtpZ/AtpI family protein n=1 Tax=Schlesneria sp. DSM 10557 TaxID=3044399 RepID=UPI00359F4016